MVFPQLWCDLRTFELKTNDRSVPCLFSNRARYIIAKYSKRMKQLGLQKTINSWLDFVDRRRRVRLVCKRMINKTLNDGLLKGFMTWYSNVAEEKREEEVRKEGFV